jgi:hypothetical protein
MTETLPAVKTIFTDDLIRRIAMDIGKEVVAHIEHAYPDMFRAVAANSAKLSIRNATYSAVYAAVRAADEGRIEEALKAHDEHRRKMRRLRKASNVADVVRDTASGRERDGGGG